MWISEIVASSLAETWKGRRCASASAVRPSPLSLHPTQPPDRYNSMHDSYTSLGGMVLLVNMLLGELVFGGLGTGIYSMVMVAAIAVFLAGLMVGRTPEYLGKKIGPAENKMIVLYALAAPLLVLPLTAIAVSTTAGVVRLDGQQWCTWVYRDFVCLYFLLRQQWPKLCRSERRTLPFTISPQH